MTPELQREEPIWLSAAWYVWWSLVYLGAPTVALIAWLI